VAPEEDLGPAMLMATYNVPNVNNGNRQPQSTSLYVKTGRMVFALPAKDAVN